MVKEEISESSQDQKVGQKCVIDPLDMISNTSNTNVSELKEELQCENNPEDHTIFPNYSDKNENHEVPYKKARINEEKVLVKKIEQNSPINEEASDTINSNSKSVFNEKDISKEIENGHCDIIDQEIDPIDMISNCTSNTNVSEMKEDSQSEINLGDHIIVPNESVEDENYEVPYKKARNKEEKAFLINIEKINPTNQKASNATNLNSKNVHYQKEEIAKESENGHCDIDDQEKDIKTQTLNQNKIMEPIGHCPKEREGPAFRCKYCWNTTVMNGRKQMKGMMTKYFCPDCQANLCIVPCFQAYHKALEDVKFNCANQNPSNDNKNYDYLNLMDICNDNLFRYIKKCVVPYCGNQGMKGFFTFPKDTAEQELWKKSCGVSILRQSSRVCHKHFKDSCFLNTDSSNKNRKRGLKKGSKPELLLSQVLLRPKCLEDNKLEKFRSDGSNDPLHICDDKMESVHEKENCAEKYEMFKDQKLLIDTESNHEALKEDRYNTVNPSSNTKPLKNNFRNDCSNLGENDPLDICGDNLELVHGEKKTSFNSEEKWKLFQCQFCDKNHYGKTELCMENPSKHPEQNTRKNVKMRLPLGEETDPLDICDNNLESVHEEKKSDTKIGCAEKYKVFETQKSLNDNNIAVRFVSVNDGRKISDFQILGYHSKK